MLRRDWVIDGSKGVSAFAETLSPVAYVKQVLAPELRTSDLVAMNDLGLHKSGAIRRAIRGVARILQHKSARPCLF
jgi:hypothetical protein